MSSLSFPPINLARRYGYRLPDVYAEFVKTLSIMMTFGLASPVVALVGCLALLSRCLFLSYLAVRWRRREGARTADEKMTDAQAIPFSCFVMVTMVSALFFFTAALLSDEGGRGVHWKVVVVCILVLGVGIVVQAVVLGLRGWNNLDCRCGFKQKGEVHQSLRGAGESNSSSI